MKLYVAMPAREQLYTAFAHNMARLVGYEVARGTIVEIGTNLGTLIASQRETLAEQAIKAGADAILWLDTDMLFPKEAAERLLAHDKEVVGANYSTRRMPLKTTAFASIEDFTSWIPSHDKTGLQACAAMGFGVMLTRTSVFKRLPKPWFTVGYNPAHNVFLGEDIYFCKKASTNGITTFIDHDLSKEVKHIGTFDYGHEHVEALMAAGEAES